MDFELEGREYIELCNLLKIMGLSESGGQAKLSISEGLVQVNGKVETRKTCKIYTVFFVRFCNSPLSLNLGFC